MLKYLHKTKNVFNFAVQIARKRLVKQLKIKQIMEDYKKIYDECMKDCAKYLKLCNEITTNVEQTNAICDQQKEVDFLVNVAHERVMYLRQNYARKMNLDNLLQVLNPFFKEYSIKVVRMTDTTCNLKCMGDVIFTISSERFGLHVEFVNDTKRNSPYIIPLTDINSQGLKGVVIEMVTELYRLDMTD